MYAWMFCGSELGDVPACWPVWALRARGKNQQRHNQDPSCLLFLHLLSSIENAGQPPLMPMGSLESSCTVGPAVSALCVMQTA